MSLKDIAAQLTTAVQTVPNLVKILKEGFESAEAGGTGIDYSDTEQDTGLKWIDGSTIYQKTINFGALPNTTIKRVDHSITNLNTVVGLNGMAKGSTSQFPIMLTNDTTAGQITILVDNTSIEVWAGSDRSSYNAYITLQYTKSA